MESASQTTPAATGAMERAGMRTPITMPPRYQMSCRRWSPYSRKGRSILYKSVSLETLSSKVCLADKQKCLSLNDAFLVPNCEFGNKTVDWELDCEPNMSETYDLKISVFNECSALVACAKMMKAAWRRTRNVLSKQTYRAENSELQAKSTMLQVFSMKSQLKDDICGMRERVKEIDATSVVLDKLEDEKSKLMAENEFLKTKIDCLTDERDCLNSSLTTLDQETVAQNERQEMLTEQILAYKEDLADLKQVKFALDNTIQETMANAEIGEEKLNSLKTSCRSLELEVAEIERTLNARCQRTTRAVSALRTIENQSKAISSEIEIATQGGKMVQDELNDLCDKVMRRNSEIGKLREKVESTAAQLAAMKSRIEMSERNVWQRIRLFPSPTDGLVRSML